MKDMTSFQEVLDTDGISCILFTANWCPDCIAIRPFMPKIEKEFSNITFYKADRDKFIDLCQELNILGIPSFVCFEHGREISRFVSKFSKTEAEIQAELDRTVEEGMFNISIASTVQFPDGRSPGELRIENVPGNRYNMQVDIARSDTGEVIYSSDILEPNYHIQYAKLDQSLPAGTYNCVATFHALDPETDDEIGQAACALTVIVRSLRQSAARAAAVIHIRRHAGCRLHLNINVSWGARNDHEACDEKVLSQPACDRGQRVHGVHDDAFAGLGDWRFRSLQRKQCHKRLGFRGW